MERRCRRDALPWRAPKKGRHSKLRGMTTGGRVVTVHERTI
jgi:hypothetical protein